MSAALDRILFYREADGSIRVSLQAGARSTAATISRQTALLALAELGAALKLSDEKLQGVIEAANVLRWAGVSHGGCDPQPRTLEAAAILAHGEPKEGA